MGYWKLDDSTGKTATDSSGNQRSAALLTGASWSGGQFGGAISFDGVNGYATISSAMPQVESANYSISTWVRPLFTPAGTDTNSLYYGVVMKRGYHFGLVFSSTNRFGMAMFLADGTNVGIETTGTYAPGRSTTSRVLSIARRNRRESTWTDNSPERVTGAPEHLR